MKSMAERLWERVALSPSGCWEWQGKADRHGYGRLRRERTTGRRGQLILAHRASWELHRGPIPPGLEVCHQCDNPRCVNPAHLFVGSHRDNMADMRVKGRGYLYRKLTPEAVSAIREALASGERRAVDLAREHRVHPTTISQIKRGYSWAKAS